MLATIAGRIMKFSGGIRSRARASGKGLVMFGKGKTPRRTKTKIVATAAAFTLIGGVAFAYWTGMGSGSGSETNAAKVLDVVVSQVAASDLAPGESVDLHGSLTNPNNTDIKVGTLTATITGVNGPSGPAPTSDFAISGNGVLVNAVVKKGAPLPWSGIKLTYANSAVNQDAGKSATVTITYALTSFVEPPATGTFSHTNGVLSIQNVASWPTSTGNMVVQPGDRLVVRVPPNGGWNPAQDVPITMAGADGVFNFTQSGYYTLAPGPMALLRAGVFYPHTPVWMVG